MKLTASTSEVSSATAIVMASARKKLPVTPVTATNGRKTNDGSNRRPNQRLRNLVQSLLYGTHPVFARVTVRNDVLNHHDRVVDHQSNRCRQAAKCHQVETLAHQPERQHRHCKPSTGITSPAISEERQSCRKTNRMTQASPNPIRIASRTFRMLSRTISD